jgi:hypothetical protein
MALVEAAVSTASEPPVTKNVRVLGPIGLIAASWPASWIWGRLGNENGETNGISISWAAIASTISRRP